MRVLGRKVVVDYQYDSEEEAKRHENYMKDQGWRVEIPTRSLIKGTRRSYAKSYKEGKFL